MNSSRAFQVLCPLNMFCWTAVEKCSSSGSAPVPRQEQNPPQFQENSEHTIAKKTTVSTKHLNFTASPSYFITQLQPLSICHWQHYYNLCHFEGPSYSGFIERLSIQKQTKKKFWRRQDHTQYLQAHIIWIPTRYVLRVGQSLYLSVCFVLLESANPACFVGN